MTTYKHDDRTVGNKPNVRREASSKKQPAPEGRAKPENPNVKLSKTPARSQSTPSGAKVPSAGVTRCTNGPVTS